MLKYKLDFASLLIRQALMITSERAGDMVFTFAHNLTDVIENQIYKHDAYIVELQRFFYTLLHKLRNALDKVSFHVKNLDGKPHYHNSVYLQLRTYLFDAVSLYYVMDADGDKTRLFLPVKKKSISNITKSFFFQSKLILIINSHLLL
ncbi:hypothetical protein ACFS5N_13475 [Mucilaginibacter ximonensis]|uniref:Uncharacterized protein n=1 Tax=Mucilaginibacter ximonensis TaxID=538021 RepID=A0ABW5YDZ1_9SPHI